MLFSKLFWGFFIPSTMSSILFFSSLFAAENELLQPKDVNKVMQQIFDQHVDKKEMSDLILRKSFNIYIDQFDPKRIYLTESDVQPYLHLSDSQIGNIMRQYKNHEYTEYQDLNNTIQASIQKARKIRGQIIQENPQQLFQASSSLAVTDYEDWRDPDLKLVFAKDDTQLKERIRKEIIHDIAGERKRYGEAVILSHQAQTFQIFEKKFREHENQYLFTLENGQPMTEVEKQNAFSMHILKSLANSLDSHTTVLNSSEAYDMRLRLEKKVEGIGLLLQQSRDGSFLVSQLIEGGAALKSGQIRLGDKILEINGQSTQKMALDNVMGLLQGKVGAKIALAVERNVDNTIKTLNVFLESGSIDVNEDRVQVSFEPYGNGIIGKIKLDTFYQSDSGITSENDIRAAIKKLDKQGNLHALILDFRENSGGFLSQAVKVAGLFI
ncbi:MAG: PDZ domain-containing protein, partial [Parachlamydiaceae bacterium]|nr:PDZ domain-containing protein [Parachlamydiaceae bacterium]